MTLKDGVEMRMFTKVKKFEKGRAKWRNLIKRKEVDRSVIGNNN